MSTLEQVATELYGLDLDAFTPRRNELAKELRASDRELASAVAALPKPVVAAWAVNHFARESADELDDLLALGEQLREAQSELAGDRMKALATNATALVQRTVKGVARAANQPLTDAVLAQVEQTFRAALADEDAASAVRAGLLVKPLEPGGFGAVDLAGSVALTPSPRPPRKKERRLSVAPPAEDRRREQARRAAESALAELERAEAELAATDDAAKAAAAEQQQAARRRDELRHDLEAAEKEARAATERLRNAEKEHEQSATRAKRAAQAAERARKAVDDV